MDGRSEPVAPQVLGLESSRGLRGSDMSGEVGHFEIPADKPDRARKFYEATFGWKMNTLPEMDYTMVSTGPVDEKGMPKEPGFIGGGIGKRGDALEHPVVTIMVDEIDDPREARGRRWALPALLAGALLLGMVVGLNTPLETPSHNDAAQVSFQTFLYADEAIL